MWVTDRYGMALAVKVQQTNHFYPSQNKYQLLSHI